MEILFGLDQYLFNFIEGSGFVFLTILGLLSIVAKETKWPWDDKIINFLLKTFQSKKTKK